MTWLAAELLPFRLSICGLDELPPFARRGVSHVLSILDPTWPDPLCFSGFPPHARVLCRFDDAIVPGPGLQAPTPADIARLLAFGAALREPSASHLLIHCHAGVSRSTAAAAILMAQRNPGRKRESFRALAGIRPRSWPSSLMIRLADEQLGCAGALLLALHAHYTAVARSDPEWAELVRVQGRAPEVPAAQ